MTLHRYAKRRDANEPEVVDALRALGATVHRLDTPVDLLVGVNYRRGGRQVVLVEVKTPGEALTGEQIRFIESWRGAPVGVVETVEDAIHFVFTEHRFWCKVLRTEPLNCWEWQSTRSTQGYGLFQLNGKAERAHRTAWELTHGPLPPGSWVLHQCDNPPCVNPRHLFLGDALDNARDRSHKGRNRDQRGELHNMAVLTALQVIDIRTRKYPRGAQRRIAREFGVSEATIHNIRNYKSWRHLAGPGHDGTGCEPPHGRDCGQ